MPAAVSRLVMAAQEDLRREISRAMHDGPAQSLTNIVLQAQIVEHLVVRDPVTAAGEVRQLIAMVQQTLDATKSFIFDVRPMVLDDLGLLPTLRRAARERGRRAGIPVEFDSMGQDRRLSMDLESGLFRMVDEALSAYLGLAPDQRLAQAGLVRGGGGRVAAAGRAIATPRHPRPSRRRCTEADAARPSADELPPALAAMIEDRRPMSAMPPSPPGSRRSSSCRRPPGARSRARAASIGVTAELLDEGSQLVLVTEATPTGSHEPRPGARAWSSTA